MTHRPRFHLAIAVDDLSAAEAFYSGVLGCRIGRSADRWIDFDLWGHQVTAHLVESERHEGANPVDGEQITVPHFGVILEWEQWNNLIDQLKGNKVELAIEPIVRFAGKNGEQGTLFLRDPAGNMLEFKAFRDPEHVFARH